MPELESRDPDLVPVHLVAYEDAADMDIDYDGYYPTVENHDELVADGQTFDEIRALKRSDAEEYNLDIVEPGDQLWRDAFEDLESGDAWRVDEL
jgi:hypothetical protein